MRIPIILQSLLIVLASLGAVNAQMGVHSSRFSEAAEAIWNDDLLTFKSLLATDKLLALSHDSGSATTLLHLAAAKGSDEFCNALLRSHADPNARDTVGGTPLEAAVFGDHLNTVKLLIESGADVHRGRVTDNAFFLSLSSKDTALVKYLLEHGCDANCTDDHGLPAIFIAASSSTLDILKLLVRSGARVCGVRTDTCFTAWWATYDSSVEKMEYLRSVGADLNVSVAVGETVLAQALQLQHWRLARYLILHGAKLYTQNDPYPPICRIAAMSDDTSLVALMINRGASLDIVERNGGNSPLLLAIANKHRLMASWLLHHGANFSWTNKAGMSPLALAQRLGEREIAEEMVERRR